MTAPFGVCWPFVYFLFLEVDETDALVFFHRQVGWRVLVRVFPPF